MKKIVALSFLISIAISLNAQIVNRGIDTPEFKQFIKSKLTVVLLDDVEYDKKIKSSITTYWTQTDFDFISLRDINSVIQDPNRSFIIPLKAAFYILDEKSGKRSNQTRYVSIINGGKKTIKRYTFENAVCMAPISQFSLDPTISQCTKRMDYIVKGLNDAIASINKNKITGSVMKMPFNTMKELNKSKGLLKEKTLVINKEEKSMSNKLICPEKIFEKYPYKYKLVSDQEFKSILKEKNKSYLCLTPVFEVNKHIMIVDPSTKKTIYYGWGIQGLTVKSKDINEIFE